MTKWDAPAKTAAQCEAKYVANKAAIRAGDQTKAVRAFVAANPGRLVHVASTLHLACTVWRGGYRLIS